MIARLEARLAGLAASGTTTTYGALARDLGCRVAELTFALEALMEADKSSGLPLRAALLNARGTNLPARGFFDKAALLGHKIADPTDFVAMQRAALARKITENP